VAHEKGKQAVPQQALLAPRMKKASIFKNTASATYVFVSHEQARSSKTASKRTQSH
jgi:hypothetical protein